MNPYRDYSEMELENHLSNFLVNNLSFSCIAQFCRNEKAFERKYIYREYGKSSASSVAGSAYHHALRTFFFALKNGDKFDLVDLEKFAFDYIDERPAYIWKLQKTTPTIEDCIREATKVSAAILKNFFAELSTYIDEIDEILHIEVKCEQFIDVNGVSIPLPVKGELDLVFRSKKGKIIIVDHKSKKIFSPDEDMKLKVGKQAIIYTLLYEAEFNVAVDEVWFIENKYRQNKDKNIKQLNKFDVKMDGDTRRLYEALLYESVKRVIEAVSDPDYVYVINDSDTLEDYADLCNFWMRTLIMEAEDFNVDPSKKEMVARRLKKTRDASIATISPSVIKKFKQNASEFIQYDYSNKDMTKSEKIEQVLRTHSILARVAHVMSGYSSDTYLLEFSAGVKISQVYGYRLDIANALDVETIRISKNLKLHDNKSFVEIECKKTRDEVLNFNPDDLVGFKIPIGKDNYGNTVVWDWDNHATPHALFCGSTGSGKSTSLVATTEYAKLAGADRIIILDPKRDKDLSRISGKNLVVINEIDQIEEALSKLVDHMNDLNKRGETERLLIVFDEWADAVDNARSGNALKNYEMQQVGNFANGKPKIQRVHTSTDKSLEENLKMLLQKSRSAGFRIACATQRASVKIISGDIKTNLPVKICFAMSKAVDSMVIIDEPGAEALAGYGDGLISSPQYRETVRFQGYYKS